MNKKYLFFISVSALLHFVVFIAISNKNTAIDFNEQGRSSLDVILTKKTTHSDFESVHKSEKHILQKATESETTGRKTTAKPYPISNKNSSVSETEFYAVVKQETNINETIDSDTVVATLERRLIDENPIDNNQIHSIISKEFSKFFYYPKAAVRKNWQGLVVLNFIIMPDGIIHRISVHKSSGYQVLDSAAINALEKVNKQQELSIALNGNQSLQTLPVNYILSN